MDRGSFGATPRLRRRRTATVATVDRVGGWMSALARRVQVHEIGRRVSVSSRFLASGRGEVCTAPPYLSLGGPVRDRRENLNAWLARCGGCAAVAGVRPREA